MNRGKTVRGLKRCSRCKQLLPKDAFTRQRSKPDGLQAFCRSCQAAYNREYRAKNLDRTAACRRKYLEEYPEKVRASSIASDARQRLKSPKRYRAKSVVNHAIRDGKLIRPETCSVCGRPGRIEGHHEDYSKPLEVTWLCRRCHVARHRILRNEADSDNR